MADLGAIGVDTRDTGIGTAAVDGVSPADGTWAPAVVEGPTWPQFSTGVPSGDLVAEVGTGVLIEADVSLGGTIEAEVQ